MSAQADCLPLTLSWQTRLYSNLGMTQTGSWLDRPLTQDSPRLRLAAQRDALAQACLGSLPVVLGHSEAVRYRGDLGVVQLSLSDAPWASLLPQGQTALRGQLSRWAWWYVGVPLQPHLADAAGRWRLTPKWIGVDDYNARNINAVVTHGAQDLRLDAVSQRQSMSSLGFLRSPRTARAQAGAALDLDWQIDAPDGAVLRIEGQNLLSYVHIADLWWSESHYHLNQPSDGARTRSFTESNEVSGRYGQSSNPLRLPRSVTLTYEPQRTWLSQIELAWLDGQWHAAARKDWSLGPGRFSLRLQDFSLLIAAYRWDLPWGRDNSVTLGWAWSRWGDSRPLLLHANWRF